MLITVAISENTQEIDQPIHNNNNKMFYRLLWPIMSISSHLPNKQLFYFWEHGVHPPSYTSTHAADSSQISDEVF